MRRNILYASRVRGDLDLGLEPSRIDGIGAQQWAESNFPGGLLPGGSYQDILETSLDQNYRIGTRRVNGNRTFHYCYATDVGGIDDVGNPVVVVGLPNAQIGCFYNSNLHYHGEKADQGAVLALVTEFDWAYKTEADGGYKGNIDIAAHDLKEALVVCYGERVCYQIADNDALSGGQVHLYLKQPVWQNFGGVTHRIYVYPNMYSQCVHPDLGIAHDGLPYVPGANQGWGGVVAVPLCNPPSKSYFWGQTWGQLPLINGLWGIDVGDRPNVREFHFDWNGTIVYRAGALDADAHMQRGGYILSSQMVMLQLAP